MKKSILVLSVILLVSTINLKAQKCYLGIGSGVNNSSGMLGVFFETPINSNFSAKAAAGIGGWGTKAGIAVKYYKAFPSSMSFGIGYSTASGLSDFEYEVELENGDKSKEKFNLKRAHMIDFTMGKSWGEKVRFNLEFGYSLKISGGSYEHLDSNEELSDDAKKVFDMLSPGGLIVGIGLSFRL